MVNEAKKFKAEDDMNAARIASKVGLESYTYDLRNSLNDSTFAYRLNDSDRSAFKSALDKTTEWLDDNQQCSEEQSQAKRRELELIASPILKKKYGV